MDDLTLPRAVAAVLNSEAYATLRDLITGTTPPGVIAAAQDAAALQRPTLAIHGKFGQYTNSRLGDLILDLRSRVGDEGDDKPHAARFNALFTALLGADGADDDATNAHRADAKSAFKAALAALPSGAVTLADYGPGANAVEQTFDGEDLLTTITLRVAWRPAAV